MKKLLYSLAILVLSMAFFSCSQKEEPEAEGQVEFYIIEDYETIDGTRQIDHQSVIPSDTPLINYDHIISYDTDEHSFLISENARQTVDGLTSDKLGVVFGVYANDELVYTGYFWSGFASSAVDWVIIDVLRLQTTGKLHIQLGYPGEFGDVPDYRNDKRITRIFKRDDKLN